MRTKRAPVVLAVLLTGQALAPAASASRPLKGPAGAGDPYFPRQGNSGYNVAAYRLEIGYTPKTKRLTGKVTITARATQRIPTDDGAFVAGEPQGSPTWFPVNDTPRDRRRTRSP